jgi:hypothetical protein
MTVAHRPLAAVIDELVGMAAEHGGNLSRHDPRQQRPIAPLRSTSVSGSANVPGWESWKTF